MYKKQGTFSYHNRILKALQTGRFFIACAGGKTFTQGEVDNLIKARLERERKGQPTKEELAAFREWQNSQKTAEQKAAELEAIVAAVKAGVPADAAEDVVALAKLNLKCDL